MSWVLLLALSGALVEGETYRSRLVAAEQKLVASAGGLVTREGDTLTIGRTKLRNSGRCSDDDVQCVEYYADKRFNGYVGVVVQYYESGDYLLVATDSQYSVNIGDRPISSPSESRFFVGFDSEVDWEPLHGAAVWNWTPAPERQRVVDTSLVAFESFTAWHGDDCVSFRGTRRNVGKLGRATTFWLFAQDGDWRLATQQPPTCR